MVNEEKDIVSTAGVRSTLRDGEQVTIYDEDLIVGSATVNNGRWQTTLSGLSKGHHALSAKLADEQSSLWTFSVLQALQLSAPRVVEVCLDEARNTLNLVKPISSATVIVDYPGMSTGDAVTMNWTGQLPTSETKYAGAGALSFIIPLAVVRGNIGGTVSVSYFVMTNGTQQTEISPALQFSVTDEPLFGTASFAVGTTSYYRCTHPSGMIEVPDSTPVGALLGSTNAGAPSAQTSVNVQNGSTMIKINHVGPQPAQGSIVFPSQVAGIGFKFLYARPESSYWSAGPTAQGGGTYGNGGTMLTIELIKTGPVKPGVIPASELITWMFGSNRLPYMSVTLTNSITITVS